MKPALRPFVLAVVVSVSPVQALAQATTLYGYDVHGRLTQAGTNSSDTSVYVLDRAGNRGTRRCCEPIGGARVLDDGFDAYFYLQTYADIRTAGLDPYPHGLQYGRRRTVGPIGISTPPVTGRPIIFPLPCPPDGPSQQRLEGWQ